MVRDVPALPQVTRNSTTIIFHTEVFPEHFESYDDDDDSERSYDESEDEINDSIHSYFKEKVHRIIKREKR